VNSEPGTVPFAIAFDPFGHLVIAEAGTNAVSTYQLSRNGTASLLHRTPTAQAATCWVTTAGSFLFASNVGTPSESGFTSSARGSAASRSRSSPRRAGRPDAGSGSPARPAPHRTGPARPCGRLP
jgi:6-phosphogluconolactonase (cycloisomerase 2 family)